MKRCHACERAIPVSLPGRLVLVVPIARVGVDALGEGLLCVDHSRRIQMHEYVLKKFCQET